ncbi:hypothetical protein [Dactylosporangium sp. CA-092794]|uniref:hypothetical protein n=1 Tax=Dactylosporangium sp. CA-092794 TaxID=3239929 RepID=UPI003D89DB9B
MTLRNAVIALFVILAAVAISKSGRDGAPRQAGGFSPLLCSISPLRVTASDGQLSAGARFQCGSPGPDRLELTVRLQRSTPEGWTTAAEQAFTAAKGETLRTVVAEQRTRKVGAPCQDGVFRSQAVWSVNGGRPNTSQGSERRNPCG